MKKLFYEYIVVFFNLSPPLNHLYPLQVENCGSNSRLVVDEGDNDKFMLERVKVLDCRFAHSFKKRHLHLNIAMQSTLLSSFSVISKCWRTNCYTEYGGGSSVSTRSLKLSNAGC